VPLVFVPGMKGSHLAFEEGADFHAAPSDAPPTAKRKRAWLTLGHLLNFPARPDDDPARDLSLPLTYDRAAPSSNAAPRQRRGPLVPDGTVDHVVHFSVGGGNATASGVDLNFLPFYGHATAMLRDMDREYRARRGDGPRAMSPAASAAAASADGGTGIFDRAGSFVARCAHATNAASAAARARRARLAGAHRRPAAVFAYDWRRPLPELGTALHAFAEEAFPGRPVQLVAHSLGGLMSFDVMRRHPAKYAPGAVVVGVPFETGIQYLQDLHKGYFTELDRCRQFTPEKQFTMSSHWGFFPITEGRCEDRFVDVSERCRAGEDIKFEADKPGIGKKASLSPAVKGDNAYFNFYDADEWERLEIGVFSPEYDNILTDERRKAYKEHMTIQMAAAKKWRQEVMGEGEDDDTSHGDEIFLPPMVACASDSVATVNQILRRRREPRPSGATTEKGRSPENAWEYDYVSGRAVPGDGRIDFDKAFPPSFVPAKRVTLDSAHAKQMCWEESGGSWGKIYEEVVAQVEEYLERASETARPGTGKARGRSRVKRMAGRARNYLKRHLRKKKLVKVVAVRPKKLSIRRKR